MAGERINPIKIGAARGRVASRLGYALLLAAVAALVALVFVRFTGSVILAVGLVAFVLAYMLVVGWLAVRNIEGRR